MSFILQTILRQHLRPTRSFSAAILALLLCYFGLSVFLAECHGQQSAPKNDILELLPEDSAFVANFDNLSQSITSYLDSPKGRELISIRVNRLRELHNVLQIYVEKGEKPADSLKNIRYAEKMEPLIHAGLPLLEQIGLAVVTDEDNNIAVFWLRLSEDEALEAFAKSLLESEWLTPANYQFFNTLLAQQTDTPLFLGTLGNHAIFLRERSLFIFLSKDNGEAFFKMHERPAFVPFTQNPQLLRCQPLNRNRLIFTQSASVVDNYSPDIRSMVNLFRQLVGAALPNDGRRLFSPFPYQSFLCNTRETGEGYVPERIIVDKDIAVKHPGSALPRYLEAAKALFFDTTLTLVENDNAVITLNGEDIAVFPAQLAGNFARTSPSDMSLSVTQAAADVSPSSEADAPAGSDIANAMLIGVKTHMEQAFAKSLAVCETATDALFFIKYEFDDLQNEAETESPSAGVIVFADEAGAERFAGRIRELLAASAVEVVDNEADSSQALRLRQEGASLLFADDAISFERLRDGLSAGLSASGRERLSEAEARMSPHAFMRTFNLKPPQEESEEKPEALVYDPARSSLDLSFGFNFDSKDNLYKEMLISSGLLTQVNHRRYNLQLRLDVTQDFPRPDAPPH